MDKGKLSNLQSQAMIEEEKHECECFQKVFNFGTDMNSGH